MKRKGLLLIVLCSLAFTMQAQNESLRTYSDTLRSAGRHPIGWVRSHPFDNWIVDFQGGAHLYCGYEDFKGNLIKRIMPTAEIGIGHWIFPVVGLRGNIGIGSSRGYITKESYLQNRSDLTVDYGNCWGPSSNTLISGSDTINGSLGGYYWPMDNNDNLFVQKWNYLYAGAELMVDLVYLKPFEQMHGDSAKWHHIVSLGFNVRMGLSENNPEKFSNAIGYSIPGYEPKGFKNTNLAAEGHIGYTCNFAIKPNLNLIAIAKVSILEGYFDRERIANVERMTPDLDFSVTFGLRYDFDFRDNDKKKRHYMESGIIPYTSKEIPKNVYLVQKEKINVIRRVVQHTIRDTIFLSDTMAVRILDTTYVQYDTIFPEYNIPDSASLADILSNDLVPYEMVFFELDKWDIRPKEEIKIARMARIIKAYPDRKFHLYGSADSKTGSVKRNDFLGKKRAEVVRDHLVLKYNIPESQLILEPLGGILDFDPYVLNRATAIIMDHPAVQNAFEKMKAQRKAGGGNVEF